MNITDEYQLNGNFERPPFSVLVTPHDKVSGRSILRNLEIFSLHGVLHQMSASFSFSRGGRREGGGGGGGGPWYPDPPPPPRPLPLLYHVRRAHLTSLLHRMHMATKRTSSILSFFSKRSKGKFCSVILFRT